MNYEDILKNIFSIKSFKGKPTLKRINGIMAFLGNPQNELNIVHVAGTNGKGSISTLVANVLMQNGYKTGKFISPFIVDFRERIQINNNLIEKDELIDYYNLIYEAQNKTGIVLTQFEFITAMALTYFRDKGCDMVVLEVGMGGRFDATNVIKTPEVAIIASISLDHTAILGDTVEKIAYEKAGIIKNNGDVVCYPVETEAIKVIKAKAMEQDARFVIPKTQDITNAKSDFYGNYFSYQGESYTLKLLGEHQILNGVTTIEALKVLKNKGYHIDDKKLKEAVATTTFYCRQEKIAESPTFLVDGAHNKDAVHVLKNSLKLYGFKDLVAIVSFMKDKDWKEILLSSKELVSEFIFLELAMPRALKFSEVESFCNTHEIYCTSARSAEEAIKIAKSKERELVLVFGSLYLASEVRKTIIQNKNL